jgi:hypothetical protein
LNVQNEIIEEDLSKSEIQEENIEVYIKKNLIRKKNNYKNFNRIKLKN